MSELTQKEITSVGSASSVSAGAKIYTNNNGTFCQTGFDALYKQSDAFAYLSPNGNAHNGIFRGKNLTSVYTVDQMYSKINAGTFDDLFLGDYFNVSITTTLPNGTVKTETVALMFAGFDTYYNIGDTALTNHHAVLIPRTSGFATVAPMNETNTAVGAYAGSYMHTTVLPCYATSLATALNNHLLTHREFLSTEMTSTTPSMAGAGFTGASTAGAWSDVTLALMSEVQVFGATIASSSFRDVGTAFRKLPVFDFIGPTHYSRNTFWLRAVASSSIFCYCYSAGLPHYNSASYTCSVRPLILFG